MSLLHKYWFIPAACAIDRSVPRKTRRSKPDSAPETWSWCLAINCCTAFLLSLEGVSLGNAPHPTRAQTPQFWLRLRRAVESDVANHTLAAEVQPLGEAMYASAVYGQLVKSRTSLPWSPPCPATRPA